MRNPSFTTDATGKIKIKFPRSGLAVHDGYPLDPGFIEKVRDEMKGYGSEMDWQQVEAVLLAAEKVFNGQD